MQVSNKDFYQAIQKLIGSEPLALLMSKQQSNANRNSQIADTLRLAYSFQLGKLKLMNLNQKSNHQNKLISHALDNVQRLSGYAFLVTYARDDIYRTHGDDKKIALTLFINNYHYMAHCRIMCWKDLQNIITDNQ